MNLQNRLLQKQLFFKKHTRFGMIFDRMFLKKVFVFDFEHTLGAIQKWKSLYALNLPGIGMVNTHFSEIGLNLSKLVHIRKNLSKLVWTCPNWSKLVQIGPKLVTKWSKLDQIDQHLFKLVYTSTNWSGLVQIGLDLFIPEMQENKLTLFKVISIMPLGNMRVCEEFIHWFYSKLRHSNGCNILVSDCIFLKERILDFKCPLFSIVYMWARKTGTICHCVVLNAKV